MGEAVGDGPGDQDDGDHRGGLVQALGAVWTYGPLTVYCVYSVVIASIWYRRDLVAMPRTLHWVDVVFYAYLIAVSGSTGIWDYVTNSVAASYDWVAQLQIQATAVGLTVIWSAVVSVVAFKLVDILIGLRVPEEEEREGLDVTSHGEKAYNL